jgi:hypothetical protein
MGGTNQLNMYRGADLSCYEEHEEEDLPAVPYVKAAVMRLFEDDPQGYTKRLDTAFSVQNIVEELHYQHSDEAVRTVLNDMSGRAEPQTHTAP